MILRFTLVIAFSLLCFGCEKNTDATSFSYEPDTQNLIKLCRQFSFNQNSEDTSVTADLNRMYDYSGCLLKTIEKVMQFTAPENKKAGQAFMASVGSFQEYNHQLNINNVACSSSSCNGSFALYEAFWRFADFLSMVLNQQIILLKKAQLDFIPKINPQEYMVKPAEYPAFNIIGITSDLLTQYHQWESPHKSKNNISTKLDELTNEDAKTIAKEMFFLNYNIGQIRSLALARHTYDQLVNIGPQAVAFLRQDLSVLTEEKIEISDKIDQELLDTIAGLSEKQVSELNNMMAKQRLEFYFQQVQTRPENIYNLEGWIKRGCAYFSDKELCTPYYKKLKKLQKQLI